MTVTNGYCTLGDVRSALNIPTSSADKDATIEAAINAASRQIDGHCGRRFWQDGTAVTREFYADDATEIRVDDISTATGLIVKLDENDDGTFATTLTISTHFVLLPRNAAAEVPVWPYTGIKLVDGSYTFPQSPSGRAGLQVTAKFGWPAIPDDVTRACVVQAVQLYKAPDAAFGAVQLGVDGFAFRLGSRINPIAAALLEPYTVTE